MKYYERTDPPARPMITVPVHAHPRLRGVDVHRSRDLDPARTIIRRNIPCTDPLRVFVDLAAVAGMDETASAIDAGWQAACSTWPR